VIFDAQQELIRTYPIKTSPSMSFLRPKYGRIREIAVEGVSFDLPKNEDEAQTALYNLPDGFFREFEWGLGIQKLFTPILLLLRHKFLTARAFGDRRGAAWAS
jgi:hypothetical protein